MRSRAGHRVVIQRVWEPTLASDLDRQLRPLLQRCFPGYPSRAYFKLPPHFRYIATVDGIVIPQLGVELRVIRIGDQVSRTFGIVDLCVDEAQRSQGLAGRLLRELTTAANGSGIDFVLLFADDDRLYGQHGWVHVSNRCSWLKIDEHRSVGLATLETVSDALMVKTTGTRAWSDGDVDLLGHLF